MTRKLAAVGLVVLIYNLFFYPNLVPNPGRLDFLVFILTFLAASWVAFAFQAKSRNLRFAYYITALSLGFIVLSLFRASSIDQTILGITRLFFAAIAQYLLILDTSKFGGLLEFAIAPLRSCKAWFVTALEEYLFPSGWLKNSSSPLTSHLPSPKTAKSIIRGVVIAIPFLFLILVFLASSDPIFAEYVNRFFKGLSRSQLFSRAFYSALIIAVLIPASVMVVKKSYASPLNLSLWQDFIIEAQIILGSITALLGSFLTIQFRYLFTTVPETALSQFGINTYSEYVRRGFGELLVVSAILYLALAIGYATLKNQKSHLLLSKLNYLLLGEFALFVISIFRRVYLYQHFHGLTRVRIYGMVFIVYVFLLSIFLLKRLLIKRRLPWYAYEISLGLILMVGIILIRPDHLIATYNPPTVNGQIDYVYISRLSIDALPGWEKAIDHAQKVLETVPVKEEMSEDQVRQLLYAKESVAMIRHQYASLADRYNQPDISDKLYAGTNRSPNQTVRTGLMVTNFAQKTAYTKLKQIIPPEVISQLHSQINAVLDSLPDEQKSTPLDRSYDSPLL